LGPGLRPSARASSAMAPSTTDSGGRTLSHHGSGGSPPPHQPGSGAETPPHQSPAGCAGRLGVGRLGAGLLERPCGRPGVPDPNCVTWPPPGWHAPPSRVTAMPCPASYPYCQELAMLAISPGGRGRPVAPAVERSFPAG